MNRSARRILIGVGVVLALLLLLLVLVPLLFAGKISDRVKTELNRTLLARVDWRSAGLSFFRHFPNLTLRSTTSRSSGIGTFQGDTLAAIRHLRVVVDLASVMRAGLGGAAPIVVRAVELDQPRLSLIALEDGTANWDITRRHHQGRAQPRPRSRWRSASGASRSTTPHIAFDNRRPSSRRPSRATTSPSAATSARTRSAVQTRADADTASVDLRRHPLPQPGAARPHRRRRGRPGQQVLHPQEHRAPPQRPQARRLRLRQVGRQAARPRPRLQARPAPTSGASCRWCRRSTPTTSTR